VDLAGEGAHADDRGQREADRLGIDDGPVAVMTPSRSRRPTRSATAGADRPTRRPSSAKATRPSRLELFEQTTVDLVEAVRFVGHPSELLRYAMDERGEFG
jgi:hypothetical protein